MASLRARPIETVHHFARIERNGGKGKFADFPDEIGFKLTCRAPVDKHKKVA
jgi:hypothetical protein